MAPDSFNILAREVMFKFADLTGLLSTSAMPQRYLWTDAFAVCNFLELYHQMGDEQCKRLALKLVDQVHNILGRHRNDDSRVGWISGLSENEGAMHPTCGGLRIGKIKNERKPGDPYDEQLEWEQDGQYYHYLTKWMHALNRVSKVTGDSTYNRWAIELAKTAHAKFTYVPPSGGRKRMYWKMSIDLSYPLVSSMGHHDPLDGFITYLQLQATAARASMNTTGFNLCAEIADMTDICEGKRWETDDPLGIGELITAAYKLAQLMLIGGFERANFLNVLLDSSLTSLQSFANRAVLKPPARYKLAFREIGLSIGLHAIEKLLGLIKKTTCDFNVKHQLQARADNLMQYIPLRDKIVAYWMEATNRESSDWMEHRDINMIMLATSLVPEGYLSL